MPLLVGANAANVLAQNAYDYANTLSVSLNNAFILNTANTANAGFNQANAAFNQANVATTLSATCV
jgi:hypothetical protein